MIVVITLPEYIDREAERIVQRLCHVDLVHLRKPGTSIDRLERLIREIPSEYHNRLVLHDHYSLAVKYNLYGVHLNSRNPEPPMGWKGSISRSCHSFEEIKEWKDRCNYLSLSPIYDSISKQGYLSAFSREQIEKAVAEGIIDNKVLALGGVTFDKVEEVERLGFGGAMILGNAWKEFTI